MMGTAPRPFKEVDWSALTPLGGRVKFLPLVWAMLWRSRARTWLTFLSVAVAFLLFGLLDSVSRSFLLGVRISGDDRLVVTYRQGLTKLLPIAYRSRIERIDGVMAVQPTMFMPGWYRDPKNQIQTIALDPGVVVDTRIVVPEDQAQAFRATRTGVLVGEELAQQHGWKLGDRIPIHSLQQKKDDSEIWEFDVVGFYHLDERQTGGRRVPSLNIAMNIDYYNEGSKFPNLVVWFTVRVTDPRQAAAVARTIDREFLNSEFETRTQSEADFQRGFVKQFGNVGKMMSAILAAVFFTLLLVAGNSMMQAFRERVPEIAVLKTLGFTDGRVAGLIAVESLLLCGLAGSLGLGAAGAVMPVLQKVGGQATAALYLEAGTVAAGIAVALAVGVLAAAVPVWRSARLTVVQGLAQS
jgi:putative ABC transport system permease protein